MITTTQRPYAVTESNLKQGIFKDCQDGNHGRCKREITHRFAQPESGIWNYQCNCECHPTAFGDEGESELRLTVTDYGTMVSARQMKEAEGEY